MLDSDTMPPSLTSKEQPSGPYSSTFKSPLDSDSTNQVVGKQQASSNASNKSNPMELVDIKFNELAKKILEELKQAQYSSEFFRAIDDIIKEPIKKTFVHTTNSRLTKFYKSQRQPNHIRQPHQLSKDFVPSINAEQQPRSLPVEVNAHINQHLANKQIKQQQHLDQPSRARVQKSAIPTSNLLHGSNSPAKRENPSFASAENRNVSYLTSALCKSATVDDATALKRQQSLRKTSNLPASRRDEDIIKQAQPSNVLSQYRRPRNYSANSNNTLTNNTTRYAAEGDDDDDDDLDDDDDDDDDTTEGNTSPDNKYRVNHSYLNQRNNPIVKSKTISDTTNIVEINMLTKQQNSTRQQLQPPTQHQLQQHQIQRRRYNPIVRSHTVNASRDKVVQDRELYHHQQYDSEPKSMILDGKDIGSLYKPHMNYSTSVLGTHRLSDDDEIIIIPTQSPSLVSNSPDPDANSDELTERFSISRTKSFWEKLSKGNHGKRSVKVTSADSGSMKANHANNKAIGGQMNGHPHTLDRMDSTGGSNSNYSCSSSGDENGVSHSRQNPTIGQIQEMSRQNRFRQTR